MTERYAEITARIGAVEQLHTVVTAMRGIAAARAAQARADLAAVDAYAALVADGIRRLLALGRPAAPCISATPRAALVVFGAEQGFAGAFTERILDSLAAAPPPAEIFLVGTRAGAIAAERGFAAAWSAPMPLHPAGIPRLADRVTEALFERVGSGAVAALDMIWCDGGPGQPVPAIERRRVFPLDLAPHAQSDDPVLTLDPETLLSGLAEDYVHAQLCAAALNAFAAENEARLAAMAAARGQIERRLDGLTAEQRQVRQEEITSEIIELAGAAPASGRDPHP
ncbi:MAG: F0F1 ATP synthase subunit gamma [Amaricoccus sp.]